MSDIHALSGAYALNAFDDIERAGFERHLAGCDQCGDEVAGLREVASKLAVLCELPPPPHLREQVLARSRVTRPLPPVRMPPSRPRRKVSLIAAAASVIALGAGVAVEWRPRNEPATLQLSVADRELRAADAESWTHEIPGGKVTMTRSKSLGTAVMTTAGLPVAPTGKVYEFWLQDPDERLVPAGVTTSGTGEFVLRGDAASAIGGGLTLEPAGGSPAPTSEPLAFFDFRSAT